jgi:hypothetical protein
MARAGAENDLARDLNNLALGPNNPFRSRSGATTSNDNHFVFSPTIAQNQFLNQNSIVTNSNEHGQGSQTGAIDHAQTARERTGRGQTSRGRSRARQGLSVSRYSEHRSVIG